MISIRHLAFDFHNTPRIYAEHRLPPNRAFHSAIGSLLVAVALAGCGQDSSSSAASPDSTASGLSPEQVVAPPPASPPSASVPTSPTPSKPIVPVTPGNAAPSISGSPITTSIAGNAYTFAPIAADADGDRLSFAITNKPFWASFNTATGVLSGTPSAADIGTYKNIVIAVSDGKAQAALPAFSLSTLATATGSTTLSWSAPTQNVDGSVLTNLGGYKIYYGTSATSMSRVIEVTNPSLTRYVVENLPSTTWYFSITTLTSAGRESQPSGVISVTIS